MHHLEEYLNKDFEQARKLLQQFYPELAQKSTQYLKILECKDCSHEHFGYHIYERTVKHKKYMYSETKENYDDNSQLFTIDCISTKTNQFSKFRFYSNYTPKDKESKYRERTLKTGESCVVMVSYETGQNNEVENAYEIALDEKNNKAILLNGKTQEILKQDNLDSLLDKQDDLTLKK